MRVLVLDAVFGSRVCKECWVPSLWLAGGSPSGLLIGCHWPLTCVWDQAALLVAVITSPGQSTVYRAWHPSLLSSESQLYPAQTQLSVVFWRHRASQHPACDWLSVVRKNAALRDQTLVVPGVELRRTHSYLDRFQIWQGRYFFQILDWSNNI